MERLVGRPAPSFTMEIALGDGQGFDTVSLSDYRGKWLVFFFYPSDFTFVCPTEIVALSEAAAQFRELDAEILGVSTDSEHCHKAWINGPADQGGLGQLAYPLASDRTQVVSEAYGVLDEQSGTSYRGLFIIDPEGVVRYSVIHDDNVGRNADEVLRVLQALQTGGLCPANWRPGQATLKGG